MEVESNPIWKTVEKMKHKKSNPNLPKSNGSSPSGDEYNKGKEEIEFHSTDIPKKKRANKESKSANEMGFLNDLPGSDFDTLGSKFDDEQEDIGSEDESNDDLDELKGWLE